VLSSDIGVIAYASPSIIYVDAVGLTSKDVLEARERGESVDAVLLGKEPRLIADTCAATCNKPQNFAAYHWLSNKGYWRTPLPKHDYSDWLRNGQLLDHCQSPDGLIFGTAHFDLNVPSNTKKN
jgi:hypothetical protein